MAPIHYQKDVQNFLTANGLVFVSKTGNVPNVPQARPIEKFWAQYKNMYKKWPKVSNDVKQFRKVWCNISKTVAQKTAQSLMKNIRKRLKQIGDKGVFAPFDDKN